MNLGQAQIDTGNVENAERHLNRALQIYREIHGENHLIIAANLNYLGYAYLQKGQVLKAKETLEEAVKIMDSYSPSHQGNLPLENNVIRRSVMSVQNKIDSPTACKPMTFRRATVHTLPDSFCADMKPLLDRASIHGDFGAM